MVRARGLMTSGKARNLQHQMARLIAGFGVSAMGHTRARKARMDDKNLFVLCRHVAHRPALNDAFCIGGLWTNVQKKCEKALVFFSWLSDAGVEVQPYTYRHCECCETRLGHVPTPRSSLAC